MSKRDRLNETADARSETDSFDTADRAASRFGREVKLGVAFIALLLLVLGGVVLFRFQTGETDATASDAKKADAHSTEPAEKPDPGEGSPLEAGSPTVVEAQSGTADLAGPTSDVAAAQWQFVDDRPQAGSEELADPSLPPSFMPRPVPSEAEGHYAGYGNYPAETAAGTPADTAALQGSSTGQPASQTVPDAAQALAAGEDAAPSASQPSGPANPIRQSAPQPDVAPYAQTAPQNPLRSLPQSGPADPAPGADLSWQTPAGAAADQAAGSTYRQPAMAAQASPLPAAPPSTARAVAPESGQFRRTSQEYTPVAATPRPSAASPFRPASQPYQGVPEDGTYKIQPGDNYWRISERVYGTGAFFQALAQHNRNKFPNADRLRVGDTLAVPDAEELEGAYPALCPKPSHRQSHERHISVVSTPRRLGTRVYVVQEGDTVYDVAHHELGKASRFAEIIELNRDVLGEDFDYLTPGMEILLPDESAEPADRVTQRPDQLPLR